MVNKFYSSFLFKYTELNFYNKKYFELVYDGNKLAVEDANINGAEITHKDLQSTVYGIYNKIKKISYII